MLSLLELELDESVVAVLDVAAVLDVDVGEALAVPAWEATAIPTARPVNAVALATATAVRGRAAGCGRREPERGPGPLLVVISSLRSGLERADRRTTDPNSDFGRWRALLSAHFVRTARLRPNW